MRILYLSAGTGSYYCGTCMRDNAVVNRLRREGHDVHLMPLYLPFSLDEGEATDCPLFFGGINSYLQQKMGIFRMTPRFFDAVLDWKPLLRKAASMADMTKANEHGDMTISMLKADQGYQRKELKRLIKWVRKNLEVDLVVISNLMLAGVGCALKRELKVPLVASMQGEDSYLDSLPEDQAAESWALLSEHCKSIDLLIGVSRFFAGYMGDRLQVAEERLRVVDNGIDLEGYHVAEVQPDPPVLGFFAHITPSKGLHTVVDTFIAIADEEPYRDWQLAIGGSCTAADEKYLDEQKAKLDAAGLSARVRYAPNLSKEDKQAFYRSLSVLAVAPTYQEAFGLYLVESIASGTPVILPARGALPELVESIGAGHIYAVGDDPQGDAAALTACLRQELPDAAALAALRAKAVTGAEIIAERFCDTAMANAMYAVFQEAHGS